MDQLFIGIEPPPEALAYEPTPEERKTKIGKYTVRRLFEGELDADDESAINNFVKLCGPFTNPIWTRPQLLRFLQANGFNHQSTLQTMQQYEEWRKTLPVALDDQVLKFLQSGVIYIQGRDRSYRPLIVLNAHMINFKEMPLEQYLKGLTYFLECVVNEMMVPGRVENWVIIMDLNYSGIIGLAINALKQVMGYLQNNYRSRLYRLYILNSTMMLNVTWNMARMFLEEVTQQKIVFVKGAMGLVFESVNKEQVEAKFGGLQANRTTYWPATVHRKIRD